MMIIGMFLSVQAQAITFNDSKFISNSSSLSKRTSTTASNKINNTANTLRPNPLKSNEFFKTEAKPQSVNAGQPVSSLNAKSVSNACEEKKEVKVATPVKCSK